MEGTVGCLSQLREVVARFLQYGAQNSLEEETLFNIRLVLNELIVNALKHGSGNARITMEIQEDRLVITVNDSGQGFDYHHAVGGVQTEQESGRGLMLVRCLCQSMEFNTLGNGVTACMIIRRNC